MRKRITALPIYSLKIITFIFIIIIIIVKSNSTSASDKTTIQYNNYKTYKIVEGGKGVEGELNKRK